MRKPLLMLGVVCLLVVGVVAQSVTTESKKVTARDAAADDRFGIGVSVEGDIAVVGAERDDDAGSDSGSAYVYDRNRGGVGNWGEVKKLTAHDAAAGDFFGASTAVDGNTAIVGAHQDDDAGAESGSAYVFYRDEGGADNWGEIKKITASDAAAGDQFGCFVAVDGDTAVIGALEADFGGPDSGSAYVFYRHQGGVDNWGEVKKIVARDSGPGDKFGIRVGIDGATVIVGAFTDDFVGTEAGSAYVFDRDRGGVDNWGQVKKLVASDPAAYDWFGFWVSVSGDTALVGAYRSDDAGEASGSAYVFARDRGGTDNWGEVKKLVASDAATRDNFGFSAWVHGEVAVIGAHNDDDGGTDSGSAYAFARHYGGMDNWGEVKKFAASDAAAGDQFGVRVAFDGETAVVGAWRDDDAGVDSGSAYVFAEPVLRASCTFRNGSGINPAGFTCTTRPILGTNWDSSIALVGNTDLTAVAIAFLPSLPIPLFGGEVLIVLSSQPVPLVLPGLGAHSVRIPDKLALLGLPLSTQGIRVDGGRIVLLNAQDLVLGL